MLVVAIYRMLMASAKACPVRICQTFRTCSVEQNSITWAIDRMYSSIKTFQSFVSVALPQPCPNLSSSLASNPTPGLLFCCWLAPACMSSYFGPISSLNSVAMTQRPNFTYTCTEVEGSDRQIWARDGLVSLLPQLS